MAIHMFRVLVGPQSSWEQADVNAAVEDWMSNQSEWTADTTSHTMTGNSDDAESVFWWDGTYRLTFDSEPKDNLFQKLEDKLVNKPDWYRVGYHECDHDSDGSNCLWSEVRDWPDTSSVPPEVPALL